MDAGQEPGFSTADFSKLYLPVDTSSDAPNVATQLADAGSLLNRVKELVRLKHNEPALAAYADFIPLYAKRIPIRSFYARRNGKDMGTGDIESFRENSDGGISAGCLI